MVWFTVQTGKACIKIDNITFIFCAGCREKKNIGILFSSLPQNVFFNFIVLGVAAKTTTAYSNNMPSVHDFSDKFNMGYICSRKKDDCLIQSIWKEFKQKTTCYNSWIKRSYHCIFQPVRANEGLQSFNLFWRLRQFFYHPVLGHKFSFLPNPSEIKHRHQSVWLDTGSVRSGYLNFLPVDVQYTGV